MYDTMSESHIIWPKCASTHGTTAIPTVAAPKMGSSFPSTVTATGRVLTEETNNTARQTSRAVVGSGPPSLNNLHYVQVAGECGVVGLGHSELPLISVYKDRRLWFLRHRRKHACTLPLPLLPSCHINYLTSETSPTTQGTGMQLCPVNSPATGGIDTEEQPMQRQSGSSCCCHSQCINANVLAGRLADLHSQHSRWQAAHDIERQELLSYCAISQNSYAHYQDPFTLLASVAINATKCMLDSQANLCTRRQS